LQVTDVEAAARCNTFEAMAVKSPAVIHPRVSAGVQAFQVAGPGKASTYILKKDFVLTLEVYQPLFKIDTAPSARVLLFFQTS